MSSLFFLTFLEMSQMPWGADVVLIHFHWINPWLTVHAHFSVSFSCLHSTVLCLFPSARTRAFVPAECCPSSVCHSCPDTSCFFSQAWLLPTILGWLHNYLAISVWDIQISPLSSGFHSCLLSELFALQTHPAASEHSKPLHMRPAQKDSGQHCKQKMSNTNVCRGLKLVPWLLTALVPLSSPGTQNYPKALLWKANGGNGEEATGVLAPERRRPGFRAIEIDR